MDLTADEFNAKFPIGTRVLYWPVLPEEDWCPPRRTKTRTHAWVLSHGTVLVSVDGQTGGVRLRQVEIDDGREEVAAKKNPVPPSEPRILDYRATLTYQLDAITAAREEAQSVRCPLCGHVQCWDSMDLAEQGLVTYHGDDGPVEVCCEDCDADFLVREKVRRTFDVAEMGEDFE